MVTSADAVFVESCTLLAVTVTVAGEGTEPGAEKRPLEEIVPQALPEQPAPATDQVAAVFVAPVTDATNCLVDVTTADAVLGDTETATVAADIPVPLRVITSFPFT